jgi:hypothetical protein
MMMLQPIMMMLQPIMMMLQPFKALSFGKMYKQSQILGLAEGKFSLNFLIQLNPVFYFVKNFYPFRSVIQRSIFDRLLFTHEIANQLALRHALRLFLSYRLS